MAAQKIGNTNSIVPMDSGSLKLMPLPSAAHSKFYSLPLVSRAVRKYNFLYICATAFTLRAYLSCTQFIAYLHNTPAIRCR